MSGWRRAADAGLAFRGAAEADLPFLFHLYASTRLEELAPVPWPEAEKTAFLDMQARAQHADYTRNYPDAERLLIEATGEPVGRLYLDRRARAHHIIDIAFLPQARNRGFGTALLSDLLDEAAAAGKPVSIHVESFNPAQRLYARLGFVTVEDQGIYRLMVSNSPDQVKTA